MSDLTRSELIRVLATARPSEHEGLIRLRGVDLSGVDMSGLDLTDVDLMNAKLVGADLTRCTLGGTCFFGADLSGADLTEADAEDPRPTAFCLNWTRLAGATLCGAHFPHASAEGADFTGADLTGANLYGSELPCAKFARAKLIDVKICGSSFHDNDWTDVIVSGGDWSHVYAWGGRQPRPLHLPFDAPGYARTGEPQVPPAGRRRRAKKGRAA